MKTRLIIEIESKDSYNVLPEHLLKDGEHLSEDEKEIAYKEFAEDLHKEIISLVRQQFDKDSWVMDTILDEIEDCWVEDWESLDDYGVSIKVI